MSKEENKNDFFFTWIIENFDMCPHAADEILESPTFTVHCLGGRSFYLGIYPRGFQNDKYISAYIVDKFGKPEPNLTIGGTLTLWIEDESLRKAITLPETCLDEENVKCVWGVYLSQRNELLSKKNVYLPNNILTIKFHAWKIRGTLSASSTDQNGEHGNEILDALSKQIDAAENWKQSRASKTDFPSNECIARTRIDVRRSTLFWPIERFSSLPCDYKLTKLIYFGMDDKPLFYLTVFKKDKSCAVEIKKEQTCAHQIFLKCKIQITDASQNRIFYEMEEVHLFKASDEETFKCNSLVQLSKLKENDCLSSTKDVLYLRFHFASSRKGANNHLFYNDILVPPSSNWNVEVDAVDTMGRELSHAYKNEKFCDVTFRSEGKEYFAHKSILSARSRVFSKMFEIDMQEKMKGVVDITDIDADTLDRMLHYLYSNQLEELSPASAVNLYKAADKYEIFSLKSKCADVLKTNLAISNMCDILNLSDTHQDTELLNFVRNFIHLHADEVFCSEEWEDLMRSNNQLAADTMLKEWRRKIYRI